MSTGLSDESEPEQHQKVIFLKLRTFHSNCGTLITNVPSNRQPKCLLLYTTFHSQPQLSLLPNLYSPFNSPGDLDGGPSPTWVPISLPAKVCAPKPSVPR